MPNLTLEQQLAIKAEIEADPSLCSARHSRCYEAMANHLNASRGKDEQLTALDVHVALEAKPEQGE